MPAIPYKAQRPAPNTQNKDRRAGYIGHAAWPCTCRLMRGRPLCPHHCRLRLQGHKDLGLAQALLASQPIEPVR